mmetsp:Transcript_67349/g.140718  ORF Transcript_67349/g.140718 Transcript_67349/m.140718 type:complete len:478 (+) Transcript_67349:166-1599(+)
MAAAVAATSSFSSSSSSSACLQCGQPAPFRCTGCRRGRFCGVRCQQLLWDAKQGGCCEEAGPSPSSSSSSASPSQSKAAHHSNGTAIDDEWICLMGKDSSPGLDAGSPGKLSEQEAQALCLKQGWGGFVTWRGMTFFRARSPAQLLRESIATPGAMLWLPAAPLRAAPGDPTLQLPQSLPEVVQPGFLPVDKLSKVTESQMNERFRKLLPTVLKDAQKGWPGRSKWTFEWLSEHYGDEEMPVSDLAPFFQHCDRGIIQTAKVTMREYIRYVLGEPNCLRSMQHSEEQVFYGNGWCPFLEHPALLADVSDRLYCVRDSIPRGDGPAKPFNASLTKVFLGPAGCVSRLHHDTYATHVWLSQIRGRKQFICYHPEDSKYLYAHEDSLYDGKTTLFDPANPDFDKFPEARKARAYSVVVEEGETVVLPTRWWHWAKSLTPSITLMRNFVNEVNMAEYVKISEQVHKAKQQQQPSPSSSSQR